MAYNPRTDKKLGSACTGNDGEANRKLTLDFDFSVGAGMNVFVGAVWQEPITDYTYLGDEITFLNPIANAYVIVVTYYTNDSTTPTSTSVYTNTLQVIRVCGIGVEVFDENLGTGNNTLNSFDFKNGNVIDGSYTLRYAASGSNNMYTLSEVTHYVLSLDEGRVLLTALGVSALATNILYASYIHSPKISNTMISTFLLSADKELERKTGNYWGTVKTTTEYFSWNKVKYPDTDEPFATEYNEPDYLKLKNKGIVTISSVKFLQRGQLVPTSETLNAYDYDVDPDNGKLVFLNRTLPNGTRNIEVIYTHGYTTVDPQVSELGAMYAGLRIFANITGGSYDDVTGYTMGRKQVQIGEAWVNIREVINQFKARIQDYLADVGEKIYIC